MGIVLLVHDCLGHLAAAECGLNDRQTNQLLGEGQGRGVVAFEI